MEVVEQSRCDIVGDYDFVLILTWGVYVTVSSCEKQTIWSKHCMSDIMSHLIMLISRLTVRNLA